MGTRGAPACRNYTECALLKGHLGLAEVLTAGVPAVGPNSSHSRMLDLTPGQLIYPTSDPVELVDWAFGNNSDYFKITVETNGPSPELQTRLVHATHALGKQTMSHAADLTSYLQVIASRSNGIQHTPDDGNLSASAIRDIKHNGQFVTPTMAIFRLAFSNPAVIQFLSGSGGSKGNSSYSTVRANVAALHKAGVPILVGTDSIGTISANVSLPFGITLHEELQNLVDIGMTPAEAINAATKVPAKYHRLADRGIIAPGMRADLLLLKSNPLVNISNTLDIEAAWVGGRQVTNVTRVGIA